MAQGHFPDLSRRKVEAVVILKVLLPLRFLRAGLLAEHAPEDHRQMAREDVTMDKRLLGHVAARRAAPPIAVEALQVSGGLRLGVSWKQRMEDTNQNEGSLWPPRLLRMTRS